MSELSQKFSKLTGLRYDIDALIAKAKTADEKKKLYDKLAWDIKNGLIRGVDGIRELVEAVLPALATALDQPTEDSTIEVETYTAETAAAYNATLPGAKTTSDWKVEPVEAVEAQEAVYYTQEEADAYNTEHGLEEGQEGFVTTETIKTPAVEAVAAVVGVHYTQEEADAYNAELDGAVKAGDPIK